MQKKKFLKTKILIATLAITTFSSLVLGACTTSTTNDSQTNATSFSPSTEAPPPSEHDLKLELIKKLEIQIQELENNLNSSWLQKISNRKWTTYQKSIEDMQASIKAFKLLSEQELIEASTTKIEESIISLSNQMNVIITKEQTLANVKQDMYDWLAFLKKEINSIQGQKISKSKRAEFERSIQSIQRSIDGHEKSKTLINDANKKIEDLGVTNVNLNYLNNFGRQNIINNLEKLNAAIEKEFEEQEEREALQKEEALQKQKEQETPKKEKE